MTTEDSDRAMFEQQRPLNPGTRVNVAVERTHSGADTMKFYLDCEFDGFRGPLISMALVSEDGDEFYWAIGANEGWVKDDWVKDNVLPILECEGAKRTQVNDLSGGLESFLARAAGHTNAHIIVDWPDDVAYFCRAMIVGAGKRIDTPPLTFEVTRVDAYPTTLPGAVQHNALWDARALRHCLTLEQTR